MTPTILGGPARLRAKRFGASTVALAEVERSASTSTIPSPHTHSTSLVSLADVRAAATRIAGVARRTPLIDVGGLHGEPVFTVKCENMQPTGAFKIRGAYNMLAQLSPDARAAGVITYSSGNHGQAVARAAQLVGVTAVVVMPETASRVKVLGAQRLGAEVLFAGTSVLE